MPVTISAPAPQSGDIKVVSSGTYTTSGTAAFEDAGNFTIPSAIGYGLLKLQFTTRRIGGAGNMCVGFDSAAGNTALVNTNYGVLALTSVDFHIAPSPGGTNVYCQFIDTNNTIIASGTTLDFSAAETVYLKAKSAAGTTMQISWVAYLIKTNVK